MWKAIWNFLAGKADPPPTLEDLQITVAEDRTAVELPQKAHKSGPTPPRFDPSEPLTRRQIGEFNPRFVVQFGVDEGGKPWGPGHCPFRRNSRHRILWDRLREGMTVEEIRRAGYTLKDIRSMIARGIVMVTPPFPVVLNVVEEPEQAHQDE